MCTCRLYQSAAHIRITWLSNKHHSLSQENLMRNMFTAVVMLQCLMCQWSLLSQYSTSLRVCIPLFRNWTGLVTITTQYISLHILSIDGFEPHELLNCELLYTIESKVLSIAYDWEVLSIGFVTLFSDVQYSSLCKSRISLNRFLGLVCWQGM